jgi:hypothetical protein
MVTERADWAPRIKLPYCAAACRCTAGLHGRSAVDSACSDSLCIRGIVLLYREDCDSLCNMERTVTLSVI